MLLLSFSLLIAQEDLVEKDFPNIGNSGIYGSFQQMLKNVDNLGGVDVEWDYSTLTNTQDYKTITWISITNATDEQKQNYPDATYIELNNTGIKLDRFFKVDSKAQKLLGFATTSHNYYYKDPLDYYSYPMKFGNVKKSTFVYKDETNGKGTLNVVYDGTGTLKLPNGNFDDVYRLKLQTRTVFPDDENDTTITNEVQFIKRGSGQLLLKLTEIGVGTSQGQNLYSFAYYVSPITSVDLELSSKIQLYPNPATNEINIEIPNYHIQSYEILDITGKSLFGSQFSKTIDISNLTTGDYFMKAILQSGKIVVKHFIKK